MNPKKTRLVLNVGVTGHRDITPTEEQCLLELSKEVLNLVSNFVKKVYKEELELYTNEEPKLRLITSLAEGFDRIAAQAALALGYEIQCPLPFSRNDYCEDFQSQESKKEFLSLLHKATSIYEMDFGRSIIDKQYLNAGIVMLDHADIVLAFWDGAPAKGPGGTMEIVELAKEKGIPTIHIDRDMLVTCGKDYIWQDVIRKEIRALLLPCDDISNNNSFPYIYFSENLERKSHASLYNNIIKLFSPKAKKKNNSIKKESFNSSNGNLKTKEKLYFDSFYNEADYLAMYYADYYRSAGALRSLIPLSANIALAVGFYWRWGENANIVNVLGFLLQVLLLYWMIRIVGDKTEKNKWHQKFIDYRILAESIKNQSYASAFGITLREIQISAYNTNDSISWINWYLRNINAEIGLPNITLNKKAIEQLLSDFNAELIIDQMH